MCTSDQTAAIMDEAEIWIEQGLMFTSVDIANSLKKRGTWIKNRDVASCLRKNVIALSEESRFATAYTMSVIDVTLPNGSNTKATLYHMATDDPADYKKTDQKALSPNDAPNDAPFEDDFPGVSASPDLKHLVTSLRPFDPRPTQVFHIHSVETLVINTGPGSYESEVEREDYDCDE